VYIQAGGKLEQSAFIARFNKTYGDEVLGAYVRIDRSGSRHPEDCLLVLRRAGAALNSSL